MLKEVEIREELKKLYKERKWRKTHSWAPDIGIVIKHKKKTGERFYTPKMALIWFERAEERIETLEWVLENRKNET